MGGAAGMTELLLQSHSGTIELLPALPSAWKEGSVKGLKARGGYEIDMAWKDGKLLTAEILSTSNGVCKIRYGNNLQSIAIKANDILVINSDFEISIN